VLALRGNQVRLGTEAPEHLPVIRSELVERVETETCTFVYRGFPDSRSL
jgi:carbon storage regulator CsrA